MSIPNFYFNSALCSKKDAFPINPTLKLREENQSWIKLNRDMLALEVKLNTSLCKLIGTNEIEVFANLENGIGNKPLSGRHVFKLTVS